MQIRNDCTCSLCVPQLRRCKFGWDICDVPALAVFSLWSRLWRSSWPCMQRCWVVAAFVDALSVCGACAALPRAQRPCSAGARPSPDAALVRLRAGRVACGGETDSLNGVFESPGAAELKFEGHESAFLSSGAIETDDGLSVCSGGAVGALASDVFGALCVSFEFRCGCLRAGVWWKTLEQRRLIFRTASRRSAQRSPVWKILGLPVLRKKKKKSGVKS